MSAWSLAIVAVIGVAAALYFAREPLVPVVTAFVVGVMLSPAARALEERKVPRLLTAALMVVGVALVIGIVVALIASPMADLPVAFLRSAPSFRSFTAFSISGGAWSCRSASIRRTAAAGPSAAQPRMGSDHARRS